MYTQHFAKYSEQMSSYIQFPEIPPSFFVIGEITFMVLFLSEFGARCYVFRCAVFREFFTYVDLVSLLPSILLILSKAEDCLEVSLTDNIVLHLASLLRISFGKLGLGIPRRLLPGSMYVLRAAALFARATVFCWRQVNQMMARQRNSKTTIDQHFSRKNLGLVQVIGLDENSLRT